MTKENLLSILESAKDKNGEIPMSLVRKAFEQLPSAQPEQRWIPCSERVPEEDEQVLVYLYDSPYIAWIDSNGEWNTEEFTLDKEKEREDEPIAWMPLPEPYKERREEWAD